jgi:hypothetical protein
VKPTLYATAAALELLGILLIAAPDFVPGALRLAGWGRVRWRRVENRVRRALGLPLRTVVHTATVEGTITVAGSLSGIVDVNPSATIDEKVEFLIRRNRESQQAVNALSERLADLERESRRLLDELRDELTGHVAQALTEAQADYRATRVWGAAILVLGVLLSTWGNLA